MAVLAIKTRMTHGTQPGAERDDDERSLIAAISNQSDVASFERLYQIYRYRLGPFMHRFIKDVSAHEEAFNDVMMAVWRKADTYNGKSKVSTWIFSIAYRHCLKALRRRTEPAADIDQESLSGPNERTQIERREVIDQALAALSDQHRMVIELAYFGGHNYREISQIADCPENTVKTRIFHARRQLKEILTGMGETNVEELSK